MPNVFFKDSKKSIDSEISKSSLNIRQRFIDFFENHGHKVCQSSPVVPQNDNSILFTNSGMVQFKKFFLGSENPKHANVTTCQKCIRAGGKHNDFENVGHTNRHHTFFEMLGNFSFGETRGGYFKKTAIELVWKFLIEELKIDKSKLWITIHTDDEESEAIWSSVSNLPKDRIVKLKGNFWSMGESGPCGACSEIFYDKGSSYEGSPPGQGDEGDRYLEIWNLVFMSYDNQDGELLELDNKCIDTGMGFERIVSVMENKESAYESSVFSGIMSKISELTKRNYLENKVEFRIIADHLRSSVFLLADGVIPSNEDSGYILRKILRRAFFNVRKLEYEDCLLDDLYEVLSNQLSSVYREIALSRETILFFIRSEYEKFIDILRSSKKIISNYNCKFTESDASFLYETHGIPFEITREVVKQEFNIDLRESEFLNVYEKHKKKAKGSWKGAKDESNILNVLESLAQSFVQSLNENDVGGIRAGDIDGGSGVGSSSASECMNDSANSNNFSTEFLGYDVDFTHATLLKVYLYENRLIMIFDKTVFYATGGGQVCDSGKVTFKGLEYYSSHSSSHNISDNLHYNLCSGSSNYLHDNSSDLVVSVETVEKKHGVYMHVSNVIENTQSVLDQVNKVIDVKEAALLNIDISRRFRIAANHSATHLLNNALRQVLGSHVMQKGSLINESKLRFDFSHDTPMTHEEISKVENLVNEYIRLNYERKRFYDTLENAILNGAVGAFEDRYLKNVFVVSFESVKEICGGTHVNRTGDIGFFKITSQSSVSSGVRRIEAVTGIEAENYINERLNILKEVCGVLNGSHENILEKVQNLKKKKSSISGSIDFKSVLGVSGYDYHKSMNAKESNARDVKAKGDKKFNFTLHYAEVLSENIGEVKNNVLSYVKSQKKSVIAVIIKNEKDKNEKKSYKDTEKNNDNSTLLIAITNDMPGFARDLMLSCTKKGGGGRDLAQGSCGLNIDAVKDSIMQYYS